LLEAETIESRRMEYPTREERVPQALAGSPSSDETRWASEMAEIRRGCEEKEISEEFAVEVCVGGSHFGTENFDRSSLAHVVFEDEGRDLSRLSAARRMVRERLFGYGGPKNSPTGLSAKHDTLIILDGAHNVRAVGSDGERSALTL
jgi:hypothetical protein